MTLKVCIMAPDRVFLDIDAEEVVLPTITGQIGILANHTPLVTGLDTGVMLLREKTEWAALALLGGFAFIQDNTLTILVNDAEFGKTIDATLAETELASATTAAEKATTKADKILTAQQLKRARIRYQVTQLLQNV